MPATSVTFEELCASLAEPATVKSLGFALIQDLCTFASAHENPVEIQEAILRALEHRSLFGDYASVLDGLVRQVGLFPYLHPDGLAAKDRFAYEFHRPLNMKDDIVFHRAQANVYSHLMEGDNVILSAPTSFGKSLVIDAVIASERHANIVIVVPTIALIDETRRRLANRFRGQYKIITHHSQARSARNVFVLTQERVLEFEAIGDVDFFVIDEFYKLSLESGDDDRALLLNQALYSLLKNAKQFYMLGPNIQNLNPEVGQRISCRFLVEPYITVVSELHRVKPDPDEYQALIELCRSLRDPTIVFCRSPNRAAEVTRKLIASGLDFGTRTLREAADWTDEHYHPEWHFAQGIRKGIAVHHGRIPRALAQYVVRLFNEDQLRLLVCTSTLIEGVNTKAKNIIIFDNRINQNPLDLFTFNNIRGRSGRMGRYFVGHVYLFHGTPEQELPFVDIPAISQPSNTPESLLIQFDAADLTQISRDRLARFAEQPVLDVETLRDNVGIDLDAQLNIAREIRNDPQSFRGILSWSGLPRYNQVLGVCNLLWRHFDCRRLGSGSALTAAHLAFLINRLRNAPTVTSLIQAELTNKPDANIDEVVQRTLDFLRLWAGFHFPRLLRALDRIQRDVFRGIRPAIRPGNYEHFSGRVENLFLDPAIIALDEYGIPVEIGRKLRALHQVGADLDRALEIVAQLDVGSTSLTPFEQGMVREAQQAL